MRHLCHLHALEVQGIVQAIASCLVLEFNLDSNHCFLKKDLIHHSIQGDFIVILSLGSKYSLIP